MPNCSVTGCDRPRRYRNPDMCFLHYKRRKNGVPLNKPITPQSGGRRISPLICEVPGCDKPQRSLQMCHFHYIRFHRGIPLTDPYYSKLHGDPPKRRKGYVIITVGGKRREEHRVVMETHLGRKLLPSEVIHHKNGIRDDNRIENLEIHNRSTHKALHNIGNKYGRRCKGFCQYEGCEDLAKSLGYCGKHYSQVTRAAKKGVRSAQQIVREIHGERL